MKIAALYSHPIKGFTPQRRASATLSVGGMFPADRLFAVEDGPSGFDPAAPAFVPKSRFTVLHKIPEVAGVRTAYDEATGALQAGAPGRPAFRARLTEEAGRAAFAAWLADALGEAARGPLKVLAVDGHRFLDDPGGHVSILNLASLRDLGERLGRTIDPLRFRANLHLEGAPAWAENGWIGRELSLGAVRARVTATITRCAAPDVDPKSARRDLETTAALHACYGHMLCGVYVHILAGGRIAEDDAVRLE